MVAWMRTVLVEEAIRDPVLDFSLKVGVAGFAVLGLGPCVHISAFLS